jgi:diguanylate cyclase
MDRAWPRGLRVWGMPWVDLRTGTTAGIEVLARWQGPSGRIDTPDRFVPRLEANGDIAQLDLLIARRAADALAAADALGAAGASLDIAVNLSGVTVSSGLAAQFARVATDRGLARRRVIFEITETQPVVMSTAASFVWELSKLGCRFALDDWGIGWSNFDRLSVFPFEHVKIDKQFVLAAAEDRWSMQVLKAMLAAARELELPVVAEGAETVEMVTLLRVLGVPFAQGFALGRPAPLEHWLGLGAATAPSAACERRRLHRRPAARHRSQNRRRSAN